MTDFELNELEGIAIVGMAVRLPGAKTVDEFWRNLCDGVESITFFSDEELIASGIDPALVRDPNYVKAGGILGDADMFDAAFFGMNPREAALMDPQHRLFLECAWQAFESAGYSPERQGGRVGVFAGQSMNTYLLSNVYPHIAHVASAQSLQASIGNDKDSLTTEVAYRLSLTGPAVTIQSSSSTSLVAIHYACQSLLGYECDMALAGGVAVHFPERAGYMYHEGGTTSPDGHCRAFDARAAGFVAGNGAAVVVLKRLADAVADGDTVHAVVKGSAVNNDGSLRVSYMAPAVDGQAEVIALAQAIAGVEPREIGYVEAHGTGTLVGDPIEVAALTQAFRTGTDEKGFCALGSVKPNIGHLDTAAGAVGLIKAALVLKHKLIPPTLHFERPNPNIDFEDSPFSVAMALTEWEANGQPRYAGVSSFGMGGTNAHAVLGEAPLVEPTLASSVEPSGLSRPAQLLLLSAKTETALETKTDQLVDHLRQHADQNLADVAYTLQIGRRRFNYRRMLVCHDREDALAALSVRDPERVLGGFQEPQSRPVVFMFSGQGAQYVNMGRELYEGEPIFRQHVDACVELLKPHLGLDLRQILYPPPEQDEHAAEQLKQTALTQPALFTIEYALAQLWMDWGVRPHSMVGHSIGEYVAACLAGVFALEEALALVAVRGRLMQQMPGGSMLSVSLPEEQVRPFLDEQLSLAVINGPSSCVLSGPDAAIDALQSQLEAQKIGCRRLHTSHAFHSAMMSPALPPFREQVGRTRLRPPDTPFISNVSGTWITPQQATDPDYWVQHLRHTVRFADGVRELLQYPDVILLEVGPGKTLATLARQQVERDSRQVLLSSLRHPREPQPDLDFLLNTVGRLWLAGVELDWPAFYARERRRRVPLPTYPFERQRYWVEPKEIQTVQTTPADKKLDVADWFYLPSWKRTLLPATPELSDQPAHWLLFVKASGDGGEGVGAQLAERLAQAGQSVVTVSAGPAFARLDEGRFAINPQQQGDYVLLLQALGETGQMPGRILHLWNLSPVGQACDELSRVAGLPYEGFYSLLFLAQALGAQSLATPAQIVVVTSGVQQVGGAETVSPDKATLLGPCKVIPQEYPHIVCRNVDVALPAPDGWEQARLVEQLLAECTSERADEAVVAYRGQQRWAQTFERVSLDDAGSGRTRLRQKGVYLITGGLGNVGYVLAEALAREVQARLVLVGRSTLPEWTTWADWLATHAQDDATSRKIRRVQALEALGAEVLVASADVADREAMQGAIEAARARFGSLNGVIHAAGTVDALLFRAIKDLSPADAQAHFRSKVQGCRVLEEVLDGQTLDFCLLTSSLASVLGGLGLAAYAAANSFMDALACRHNQTHPSPWFSVNWDAWQLTAQDYVAVGNPFADLAITAAEGADAFRRLLSLGSALQVLVSTSNLQARIAQWATSRSPREAEREPQEEGAIKAPRPNLQTAYVAPRDDVERQIAQVWQEMLGVEQVGVYDNFFDLGGNSLVGVQLIARLTEEWQVQIPAVSLYEGPTIYALAKIISQLTGDGADEGPAYEASRSRGERRREKIRRRRRA